MEKQPLVSICSITYNHAPYIRQCLDGMLMQQTNFLFEIIINDDCSTDGTTDIIREYVEKYPDIIRPIYHEENQYQKGVRGMFAKFVFPKAHGKYIALCEGDDYWTDPLKLQKQVDFLEGHPEFSMCCTDYCKFIQATGELHPFSLTSKNVIQTKDLMQKNQVATLTVLVRSEYLSEYNRTIAHNLPLFPMGDYPLWIWISNQKPIYRIGEATSVYRVLEESASHSANKYKKFKFMLGGYDIQIYFNKLLKLNMPYLRLKRAKSVLSFCIKNREFRLLFENLI